MQWWVDLTIVRATLIWTYVQLPYFNHGNGPIGRYMRWQTGKIGADDVERSQYTCVYCPFTPHLGSSSESYVGNNPRPCSQLLYWGWNSPPATKRLGLVGWPSFPSLSFSLEVFGMGLTYPERPSCSAYCDLGWWGGRRAYKLPQAKKVPHQTL